MSTATAAARAYSNNQPHTKSYRDLEYDVMLSVTRDLKRASAAPDMPFPKLVDVLRRNEKLWTEIGVQVASHDNALPNELRASLFYMTRFVIHHTTRVLKGEATPDSLLDINIAVLRGLKGDV